VTSTVVLDRSGNVVLVVGAAGGPRIITTVLDAILGVVDYG
jgi:gamma-glutamyltranspeptidase